MLTKPSVETTADEAPVTGLPQTSSLISRATLAWIGATHWATMSLSYVAEPEIPAAYPPSVTFTA
jgi:hypothetical protein